MLAVDRVTYVFPSEAELLYVYVLNFPLQTREEYFQTLPDCLILVVAWLPSKSLLFTSWVDIEVGLVLLARLPFWNMKNKSETQIKQLFLNAF